MNAQLKLFLLGPFRVERAGQPLTDFKSNKVRALLAYLAVERDMPQHRDVLAGLLWPESANALAMLRDALSNLRRVLDDRDAESPIIRVVTDTLQLDPAQLWLDVAELDALTTRASRSAVEATLARAAALYRGDFLDGFTLTDTPDFEMWVLLQRETLRRAVQDALYRLATLSLQRGDYAAARTWARRQLALNRYREAAHRQLLRALALDGQRNRALAHYAEYCALLDEELGVTPDVRTTALYQRIRAGSLRPDTAFAPLPPLGAPLCPEDGASPSPFVGRAAELQRLVNALQRARQGEGQVLFVTGEAGSGKTMLVQTFAHRILARADDVVVARGSCNAQIGTGDPYLPFREILRLLTGDFDVPAIGDVLTLAYEQQLETFVPLTLQALREQGADLIDRLVSLHPESGATSGAKRAGNAPTSSKRPSPSPGRSLSAAALCDQVTRVLRTVARQCALLLVLDDLQWADSGTLNLLTHLGRRLAGSRILLVGIYRPAETGPDHPLLPIVHELQQIHGDVVLDLDQAGGQDFVDAFLDSMPNLFAPAFRAQLARQTGGHALFTAALIQQMQEEGALVQDTEGRWRAGAGLDWSQLPPRVEAVIAKRLARLSPKHQELLALASVEGETFTAEVVARVSSQSLERVERALRALGGGKLSGAQHNLVHTLGLERVAGRRVARYQFRHALFQQYLYARLDPVRRARLHEAIGRALETLHAGHWDAVAARLAYHFEAADLAELAVGYLFRAGQHAYRLSAPLDAIALYRRGLGLLAPLPESTSRTRLELALQMHLEAPLLVTQGWGAPERAAVLERAYTLAQQLGDIPDLLIVLYALTDLCTAQARHPQALDYAEQLLALAQQAGDRGYEALGYRMTGTAHFFLGHYREARAHLEKGLSCYATVTGQASASSDAPIERAVFLWAWLPHILFALGYPEQAVARSREALACVQPHGPAYAQAMMMTMACVTFYAIARQPEATLRHTKTLLALTETYDLAAFQGWAIFCRGWARTALGQTQTGLSEMVAGWEHLQATGAQSSLSPLLTLLAEAYLKDEAIEKAEETLHQVLALAEQHGERSHLAEIYRVQGVLHRKRGALEAAEASLTRAIQVARDQAARLWELRATVSLFRLRQAQGPPAAVETARQQLADLYAWFSEGFDTPDLQAAAALLSGDTKK